MKVFVSWSGTRSKMLADRIYEWLPHVIHNADPWMSNRDINKGGVWFTEMQAALKETGYGIFCITPEARESTWIHFEAGAVWKALEENHVSTYLYDVDSTEIKGPLSQFQDTKTTKDDTWELIQNINKAAGETKTKADVLAKAFETFWPDLEDLIESLKEVPTGEETEPEPRDDGDILREILTLVRRQSRERPLTLRDVYGPSGPTVSEALTGANAPKGLLGLAEAMTGEPLSPSAIAALAGTLNHPPDPTAALIAAMYGPQTPVSEGSDETDNEEPDSAES